MAPLRQLSRKEAIEMAKQLSDPPKSLKTAFYKKKKNKYIFVKDTPEKDIPAFLCIKAGQKVKLASGNKAKIVKILPKFGTLVVRAIKTGKKFRMKINDVKLLKKREETLEPDLNKSKLAFKYINLLDNVTKPYAQVYHTNILLGRIQEIEKPKALSNLDAQEIRNKLDYLYPPDFPIIDKFKALTKSQRRDLLSAYISKYLTPEEPEEKESTTSLVSLRDKLRKIKDG